MYLETILFYNVAFVPLFLVIGDEILKAQVKDTNSYYMCSRLYKCGIQVKKVINRHAILWREIALIEVFFFKYCKYLFLQAMKVMRRERKAVMFTMKILIIMSSVLQISVISDNVEEISKEIKDASSKFTYVITSGGIGPTHDDVTYEGKNTVSTYIKSLLPINICKEF